MNPEVTFQSCPHVFPSSCSGERLAHPPRMVVYRNPEKPIILVVHHLHARKMRSALVTTGRDAAAAEQQPDFSPVAHLFSDECKFRYPKNPDVNETPEGNHSYCSLWGYMQRTNPGDLYPWCTPKKLRCFHYSATRLCLRIQRSFVANTGDFTPQLPLPYPPLDPPP